MWRTAGWASGPPPDCGNCCATTPGAPVLILATLWPQYWDTLIARPPGGADPHA
jgi:hypothetical protein